MISNLGFTWRVWDLVSRLTMVITRLRGFQGSKGFGLTYTYHVPLSVQVASTAHAAVITVHAQNPA